MKVEIRLWQTVRRIVRIAEEGWYILSVIKNTDEAARIKLRCELPLDIAEAKSVAKALNLAAKVAWYLDDLESDEALDAIEGLNAKTKRSPTTIHAHVRTCGAGERIQVTTWNEVHPHPRAGRTEN